MCHTTWVHYHIIRANIIIVHILERFMQNLFNILLVSVLPLPGMMLADAATSVP